MTPASPPHLLAWTLRVLRAGLVAVLLVMCTAAPAAQTDFPSHERSSVMAVAEMESAQPEL